MAEEFTLKRVIAMTDEASSPSSDQYMLVDSDSGAKKMKVEKLMVNEAPEFSTSETYAAGDIVIYNAKLYVFTAAHAAGAWIGTDAQQITLGEFVSDVKSDINNITSYANIATEDWINKSVSSTGTLINNSSCVGMLIPVETGHRYFIDTKGNQNRFALYGNTDDTHYEEVYKIDSSSVTSEESYVFDNTNATYTKIYLLLFYGTTSNFNAKLQVIPDQTSIPAAFSVKGVEVPTTGDLENDLQQFNTVTVGETDIEQVISSNTHFRFVGIKNNGEGGKYVFTVTFVNVATNCQIAFRAYSSGGSAIKSYGSFSDQNSGDVIRYEIPDLEIPDASTHVGFVFYGNGNNTQEFTVLVEHKTPVVIQTADIRELILSRQHGRMEYGAHQGARDFAPVGSYAAYRVAGEMGFDWAWIAQIKHSADDTMWVCHNDTLNSITDYTGTKTISEMTDDEIRACKCNREGFLYKLSDFPASELRIPTLGEVISLCVKFGMKMYFRADDLPTEYVEGNRLDTFVTMIKSFGIGNNDAAYSITNNTSRLTALRTYLGNDIEISPFFSTSTTAQDYIDWLDTNNVTNRSVIMPLSAVDEDDVQLLHKNNVKVYLYDESGYGLSREDILTCASWGVDAVQSGYWYYLPY